MLGEQAATRILIVLFMALCALLLVAGCSSGSDSSQKKDSSRSGEQAAGTVHEELVRSYEPSTRIIVTRKDPSLPDGCRPRQVAGLVTSFFDAFNEGDQGRLARFFVAKYPQSPGLFGGSASNGFSTYRRDDLLKYFARRHEHKERLQLLRMDVDEPGWDRGVGEGAFVITRHADDLRPGLGGPNRVARGKFILDCKTRRIMRWQMAMEMPGYDRQLVSPHNGPCKEPPGWKPGTAALVCARKEG